MLVIIGATPEGKKERLGLSAGMRESAQSGKKLLVDLKARGLVIAPEIAVGDGALGFWKALDEAFPSTRHQRCWVHKTLNVLDKLPKALQNAAHKDLREMWLSESRAAAQMAMDVLAEKFAAKTSEGGRLPDERPRCAADVFRFSCRALDAFANLESDRKRLCDGVAQNRPHERRALAGYGATDGVQAGDGGVEKLAQAARTKAVLLTPENQPA